MRGQAASCCTQHPVMENLRIYLTSFLSPFTRMEASRGQGLLSVLFIAVFVGKDQHIVGAQEVLVEGINKLTMGTIHNEECTRFLKARDIRLVCS